MCHLGGWLIWVGSSWHAVGVQWWRDGNWPAQHALFRKWEWALNEHFLIAFWSWCRSNVSAGVLIIAVSAARSQLLCLFQPRPYCWVSGVHVLAVLAVRPLHTWQLPAERVGGWHAGGYLIRAGKQEGKEAVVLQAEGLGGMGACWHLGTEGWCCGLNLPVSAQQSPCLVVESSEH